MFETVRRVDKVAGLTAAEIDIDALIDGQRPVVFTGLARAMPLVRHGLEGPAKAADYIKSFYRGTPVVGYTGEPGIDGRFFYNDDVSGMNFRAERVPLDTYLDRILAGLDDPASPAFYVGSTDVDAYLPGLGADNALGVPAALFGPMPPLVSIWIGNRTVAATHYDMSNNLACCMVGRRRFLLFQPDQVHNLYPGPLEPTPGGQVVSMVDPRAPDLGRYPGFADALAAAWVAELEPGDVLFYPALWWHQVEALDRFNVMINIWWNRSPRFMDTPMTTILHGLLSLRDRPEPERRAWRALFDYYVFDQPDRAAAHLPDHARGPLGPMDEPTARRLRASLLNRLNR